MPYGFGPTPPEKDRLAAAMNRHNMNEEMRKRLELTEGEPEKYFALQLFNDMSNHISDVASTASTQELAELHSIMTEADEMIRAAGVVKDSRAA